MAEYNFKEKQEQKRRKEKKTAIFAWITAGAIILIVIAAIIISNVLSNRADKTDGGQSAVQSEQDYRFAQSVAAKTEHFTVTGPMMEFFFNNSYQSFIDYYGEYLSQYTNLDISADLTTQYRDENTTWFEYFENQAKQSMEQMLFLCEGAQEEGISLSDDELKAAKIGAENYNTENYGKDVTTETIEECIRLNMLSNKYADIVRGKADCSDETMENYFNNYNKVTQLIDYATYYVTYNESTDQQARQEAEKLAQAKTKEEFLQFVENYITENEIASGEDIPEILKSVEKIGAEYGEDVPGDWMYEDSTQVGDTFVYKNEDYGCYDVYMLLKKPYKDESPTKNVRHILLTEGTYDSLEKANVKAQDILAQWKKGEKTAESFGLLATSYSDDTGSCFKGGLYRNIKEGEMVPEFNSWCFDPARQPGDADIIKSDYGYHVMYFDSEGDIQWRAKIKQVLMDADYNERFTELEGRINIEYDEDAIYHIQVKA